MTGRRSGEVTRLRMCEIDAGNPVSVFRPVEPAGWVTERGNTMWDALGFGERSREVDARVPV